MRSAFKTVVFVVAVTLLLIFMFRKGEGRYQPGTPLDFAIEAFDSPMSDEEANEAINRDLREMQNRYGEAWFTVRDQHRKQWMAHLAILRATGHLYDSTVPEIEFPRGASLEIPFSDFLHIVLWGRLSSAPGQKRYQYLQRVVRRAEFLAAAATNLSEPTIERWAKMRGTARGASTSLSDVRLELERYFELYRTNRARFSALERRIESTLEKRNLLMVRMDFPSDPFFPYDQEALNALTPDEISRSIHQRVFLVTERERVMYLNTQLEYVKESVEASAWAVRQLAERAEAIEDGEEPLE